jgi:hypothetical protein
LICFNRDVHAAKCAAEAQGQLSLRGVANELAARGFFNERGRPFAAKSVASML